MTVLSVKVSSILCYLLACLVLTARTELFTAVSDLERILHAESQIAHELRNYVAEEEKRLTEILRLADDYERHSEEALQDKESYLSNPLNAFLLVKRFTTDWQDKMSALLHNNTAGGFMGDTSSAVRNFPDSEDLAGAAVGLIRLQDTYALNPKDIARGDIGGVQDSPALTAADCLELGRQLYFLGDYDHAIPWFYQTLDVLEQEEEKTANKALLLDFLSFSTYMQGNIRGALNITLDWLRLDPENARAQANKANYEEMLRTHKIKKKTPSTDSATEAWRTSHEFKLYERLCRGEDTQRIWRQHQLSCHFRRHHPLFYIQPVREETLSFHPWIVVYHNVLTQTEMAKIKELSIPKLHRSGTFSLDSEKGDFKPVQDFRISKSAWLPDGEDPMIAKISQKIMATVNLSISTSEHFQVLNYGIGGHYEPHMDFVQEFEFNEFPDSMGNRVATFICYMSNVKAGGATVFPTIGVKVFPVEGSCAFWYNLKRNGYGDYRTRHAGCPVLAGQKWVCNKWFHERGQEVVRPCSLDPDE